MRDFEFYQSKRGWILLLASLQTFAAAGIFYGWSAMKELLISEGAFQHICLADQHLPCPAQLDKLNLVYTVGQFSNLFAPLLVGVFLDIAGPKLCSVFCLLFVGAGVSLLGMSSESFQAYFPALVLIAVGGPGIQTSCFFSMNLFPTHANSVSSLISGVFQLGFVVFLGMKILVDAGTTFRTVCFVYSSLLMLMAAATLFLFPKTQLSPSLVVDAAPFLEDQQLPAEEQEPLLVDQDNHTTSLMKTRDTWGGQLMSAPFLLLSFWMTLQVYWANTYIGTVGSQINFIDSNADVPKYVSIFNLVLPLGVITIPFYGKFMDRCGFPAGFAVASITSLMFAVCYCIQNVPLQIFSFVCYAISRTCVFAAFFSYTAYEFGYKYFGTVTGGVFLMMSVFSLLQYPMTTHLTNFSTLGYLQLASFFVCGMYTFYLQRRLGSKSVSDAESIRSVEA